MMFVKYHGTGNDFIILDGMERGIFLSPGEVEALCRRHTGIGADGVIFACTSSGGMDVAMRIFNADGSEAEMCGNGIRCLAKFAYERMGIRKEKMMIETAAGVKPLRLTLVDDLVKEVEVEMGLPEFRSNDLPDADEPSRPGEVTIIMEDGEYISAVCLSMGNPHCVIFVDDAANAPVNSMGPLLERHKSFPNRTNVGFAQITEDGRIVLRVWERGVGETQACGTGACAAAVAALHTGKAVSPMEILLTGGALKIRIDDFGHVHMAGPAVEVFDGELNPVWWEEIRDRASNDESG
jgi:diaminopimelate epimerase